MAFSPLPDLLCAFSGGEVFIVLQLLGPDGGEDDETKRDRTYSD
jgi:hypothetical protein